MRIKNSVRVLHKVLRGIWGDCRVGKGGEEQPSVFCSPCSMMCHFH